MRYEQTSCDSCDIKILDACCGSRIFWFDKNEPHTTYMDIRDESHVLCDGRILDVHPDIIADCRHTGFPDDTFNLIVFDPPHLVSAGDNSWLKKKYGKLPKDWESFLHESMAELMRVLKVGGTLIFKWNETQVKLSDVLSAIEPFKPLLGQRMQSNGKTIWLTFMKF